MRVSRAGQARVSTLTGRPTWLTSTFTGSRMALS